MHIGENSKTDLKYIAFGFPQRSILGTLWSLVYAKALPNASCVLDPIVFVSHTNLSLIFSHKDIKYLFTVVKKELGSMKDWLTANKLSLNVGKTKYSFFNKPSKKEDIHLCLPKLIINNYEIQREESIKFLRVI